MAETNLTVADDTPTALVVREVIEAGEPYQFTGERQLQERLAVALTSRFGDLVHREDRLNDRMRIDFMVGGVGVEVKVKGAAPTVARQLAAYAAHPAVDELLLVSTVPAHIGVPAMTFVGGVGAAPDVLILSGGAL
ncbi:hypothetical protein LGT39_05870 [Demequina sp. TTPB684]|uniref:hypothetical protein n=1 Tax=unclassified Demequina TaxID=2620311 RepID=UPI001CF56FAB|nr:MULTISPECIES: hypothetical protein [unclassified Demequina]MCB2412375.1 hypothetical protein [Demequina sp. TTPB684]UPU89045.1 hypothetical protein LGT36_003725 [Demequina sp. TMPB413]